MSIVTVQIGQCGNQIGEKLFETIASDCFEYKPQNHADKSMNNSYVDESKQRFFDENISETVGEDSPLMARAVLVDMESKVVNRLVSSNYGMSWKFRTTNSYTQKKGSGNNWSYGYCVNGPKSSERIEEIVQGEVERCDRLAAFHVCMSLAGGTGSGVGTYYSHALKTLYPRTTLVNTLVWPFAHGEVVLQNYNLLLTLDKIYECSDALFLVENDAVHYACKRVQAGGGGSGAAAATSAGSRKDITFDHLNSLIGHQLASVLQPATDRLDTHNYLDEIISDLCSHTDYKLLSLTSVPHMSAQAIEYSSFQWPGVYKSARSQLLYGSHSVGGGDTVAQMPFGLSLFARGGGGSGNNTLLSYHDQLKQANFGDLPVRRVWHHRRGFNRYEKCLSVLNNTPAVAHKIETLLEKAWRMFDTKAYVHQYTRFDGFEEDDLLKALIFAQQLVKNYQRKIFNL